MKTCYNCNVELNGLNKSVEHILPNSCGGILTSNEILCITCNSLFGHTIDADFASQIAWFMHQLMIEKERGDVQPVRAKDATGKEYIVDKNHIPTLARPYISETQTNNGTTIKIQAPKKMLKKALNGLKRKYKDIDVEQVLNSASLGGACQEPLMSQFALNGSKMFRAILKIVVEFYLHKNHEWLHIKDVIPLITVGDVSKVVNNYYPSANIYVPQKTDEISHVVFIRGDSVNKKIYGYVELFNTLRYIIKLSDNYIGQDFQESYTIDLDEKIEKYNDGNIRVALLTHQNIESLLINKKNDASQIEKRLKEVVIKASNQQRKKSLANAIDSTLGKYPNGTPITDHMLAETCQAVSAAMLPYII